MKFQFLAKVDIIGRLGREIVVYVKVAIDCKVDFHEILFESDESIFKVVLFPGGYYNIILICDEVSLRAFFFH